MTQPPQGAPLSEDGNYWWDGSQWQLVATTASQGSQAGATQPPQGASLSEDGNYWWDGSQWQPVDQSGGTAAGGQAAAAPTDLASERALADQADQAEVQALAAAVAAGNGISGGFGGETLVTSASDASPMAGEDVRAQCGSKCDLSVTHLGEVFALVACGDGTCPSCPPGLGNLIVKHWCAYVGITSQRNAIVLHLAFGATWGPFLVP